MESQLRKLGDRFVKWSAQGFKSRNIIGLNCYHAGLIEGPDEGAMSDQMILSPRGNSTNVHTPYQALK